MGSHFEAIEIRLGGGRLLAALVQNAALASISDFATHVAEKALFKGAVPWIGQATWATWIVFPLAAWVAEKAPQGSLLNIGATFIDRSGEKFVMGALVVHALFLAVLGDFAFLLGGTAVMLYYGAVRAHLVSEKVMKVVRLCFEGILACYHLFRKRWGFFLFQVLQPMNPKTLLSLWFKIDSVICKILGREAPLRAFFEPMQERNELSFQEISNIFWMEEGEFSLNYAHCSHFAHKKSGDQSSDYALLQQWFDEVRWEEMELAIKAKCRTDERWQQEGQGENCLTWISQEMRGLVEGLEGKKRMAGTELEVRDCRQLASELIPYLDSLRRNPSKRVEFEDALLVLAIEGGNYCAKGVRRALRELVDTIDLRANGGSVIEVYENKIKQALQNKRQELCQWAVNEQSQFLKSLILDVHLNTAVNLHVTLGFYPLSESEEGESNLVNLGIYELSYFLRKKLYYTYLKLAPFAFTLSESGTTDKEFFECLQLKMAGNSKLSSKDLEDITMLWVEEGAKERFERLALFMMGVLNFQAVSHS